MAQAWVQLLLLLIAASTAFMPVHAQKSAGATCAASTECASSNCRGGRCCADIYYSCERCNTQGTCATCNSDQFLQSGRCVPKRSSGGACSAGTQCISGYCKGSRCCASSTHGTTCATCGADGRCATCRTIPAQNLYQGGCYTPKSTGQTCGHDGECTSTNQCRGGRCCAPGYNSCAECNAVGHCSLCPNDHYPSNSQCLPKNADGGSCTVNSHCLSGDCTSSRCCAPGYTTCEACRSGDGRCQTCDTTIRYMTPASNCAAKKANGDMCSADAECLSGSCVGDRCCAVLPRSCANCSSDGGTCETCADGWRIDAASGNCTAITPTVSASVSATASDGNASTPTATDTISASASQNATASGADGTTSMTVSDRASASPSLPSTSATRDSRASPTATTSATGASVSRTGGSESPSAPTRTLSLPTPSASPSRPTRSRSLNETASATAAPTLTARPSPSPSMPATDTASRFALSETPSGTLVPTPPPASAVPVVDSATIELVTQNTARGVAIGAATSGTPAVATQAGRVEALAALIACRSDESNGDSTQATATAEQPGWSTHPTRFRAPFAGRGRAAWDAATVIGNLLLLALAAPLLAHGVAAPLRLLWRRRFGAKPGYTYAAAVTWCRSPGVLSLAVAFLLPSVAERSAALATDPVADAVTAGGRAVGVWGLLLVTAAHVAALVAYRRWFAATFVWQSTGDDSNTTGDAASTTDVHSRLVLALSGADAWAAVAAERSSTLLRRFGMLFDSFSPRAPWFLLVDVGVACVVGCLAGMQAALGCAALGWAITAVSVAFALLVTALRPHAAPFDVAAYVAVAWLQAAAALAATVAPADASSTAAVHSAAAMSVTVLGVYEVAKAVYLQCAHRLQRAQESHAHGSAAALRMPMAPGAAATAEFLMQPAEFSAPLPVDSTAVTPADIEEPLLALDALPAVSSCAAEGADAPRGNTVVSSSAPDLVELLDDGGDTVTPSARSAYPVASRYRERVGHLTAAQREAERRRLETRTDLAALLGHEDEARAARELAALIDDTTTNGADGKGAPHTTNAEEDSDGAFDPTLLL